MTLSSRALLLSLVLPTVALAEGIGGGAGTVDWQRKVITCKGSGAPNLKDSGTVPAVARIGAERAAKMDALRNCLEVLKGINIKTGETVGAAMTGDSGLKAKVEGVVKGFKVIGSPRYFQDGGVEMDVEVPLDGALADALLPKEEHKDPPTAGKVAGSGLIINAKGLKLAPALAPRVLDEAGKEVYGPAVLTEDAKRQNGVAAYARDVESAKKNFNARIGTQPVVLKALKANGADVVISTLDADTLRNSNLQFLAEGKVVIVTD
jgi:hypothetical protein